MMFTEVQLVEQLIGQILEFGLGQRHGYPVRSKTTTTAYHPKMTNDALSSTTAPVYAGSLPCIAVRLSQAAIMATANGMTPNWARRTYLRARLALPVDSARA